MRASHRISLHGKHNVPDNVTATRVHLTKSTENLYNHNSCHHSHRIHDIHSFCLVVMKVMNATLRLPVYHVTPLFPRCRH